MPRPPKQASSAASARPAREALDRRFSAAAALELRGQWAEAEQTYLAILSHEGRHFGALHNLGYLRLRQGKLGEAEPLLRKALSVQPRSAPARNTLGLALHLAGRFREAAACFQKAVSLDPAYAQAHNNLGAALHQLDRPGQAVPWYQKAISLDPAYADAHRNLGNALHVLGRTEEARLAFEAAIGLAPRRASFYHSLSDSKRFAAGDPYLAAMEALARESDQLPQDEQIHLHFALGKVLADVGEYGRSFGHLQSGNRLKRKRLVYDEAAMLRLFERVRAAFSGELLRRHQGQGDRSAGPIFVIGMMRSGTTLIEQILASHPEIVGAGERADFQIAADAVLGKDGFPERAADLSATRLREIGAKYLASMRAGFPGARRVVDKMPTNFFFAGLIAMALPNARIVHARRDAADTCLSCFATLFKGDLPFTYDLAELGRYYRAYERLMAHWREALPCGVMLEVSYEELVANLEEQTRRLLAHCGVPWDPACLAFHATNRSVQTASAAQVRQPIYRSSVGRWRAYGESLQPLLEALASPG